MLKIQNNGLAEKRVLIRNAASESLKPPPNLTISEWADLYRVLPRTSSSEHGLWRTSRFPFLKRIMDVLSPQDPCKEVAVMKGAQLGFTEVSLNRQFYIISYYPAPYLYMQKTLDNVKKYSKQRFGPSSQLVKSVVNKLSPVRSRDSSNTILLKTFPGGLIVLGGANSAASLRSMSIMYLDVDEWDSYEQDVQDEGDPVELAIRRTANYPRRKIYYFSTPTLTETSKIEPKFLEGTQEYYYVTCIHCKHSAPIAWKESGKYLCFTIKYKKDDPKTAMLYCPNCTKLIEEKYKTIMLSGENGAKWVAHNPSGLFPSFHISSLYSPLGFYSWQDAVALWIKASRTFDKELLKVFINTVLGESYSEAGKHVESIGILKRRERYTSEVPKGVMLLVCGVDIQDKRIECEVVGFGEHEESWSIDYRVFTGDTALEDVWNQLDLFLQREWTHESGHKINLAITMIDSGYNARKVYSFCKAREHRRVYPIKGMGGWGKGLIKRPTRKNGNSVFLFIAYVDEIKNKFYSQLNVSKDSEKEANPQYCHFPKYDHYNNHFFKMLSAEKLIKKTVRGFIRLEWDLPKGRRNEALDCRCYCIAGLNIINPNFDAIKSTTGIVYGNNKKPLRRKNRGSKGI